MNIGHAIKTIRKEKGLSQIHFAKIVDISQTYLSQLEANRRNPTVAILSKISETTNVPLPIIMWYSLEESDIKDNDKKALFRRLNPIFISLIESLY